MAAPLRWNPLTKHVLTGKNHFNTLSKIIRIYVEYNLKDIISKILISLHVKNLLSHCPSLNDVTQSQMCLCSTDDGLQYLQYYELCVCGDFNRKITSRTQLTSILPGLTEHFSICQYISTALH